MYLYWQKCHKKPFPLVYCQSHKEKSVKGGRKTAEFPLDTYCDRCCDVDSSDNFLFFEEKIVVLYW